MASFAHPHLGARGTRAFGRLLQVFAARQLKGWQITLALLVVVILSYGVWIPWMGLFGNDLPYLWYYHLLGAWGPGEFASIDRPVSTLFYAASMSLLGETVWHYHVFLLILRWLSAVGFWWVLTLVWPERRREAATAALLFAVYPGFRQNPVALEFILHFYVLDLFLVSLAIMLLLASREHWNWWLALATAACASGLFSLEYFIGLEILRPIFLWIVTRRQGLAGGRQWKKIVAAWLPSLVVVLAFLFWRVFVFSFPTYQPVLLDSLRSAPLAGILSLLRSMARDMWTALAGAWVQTLRFPEGNRAWFLYLVLAAASFVLAALVLFRIGKKAPAQAAAPPQYWGESALAIGLLAMLAGGSIFWFAGIPVTLDFPWDRSTLSFMPGASLVVVGLLEMLVTPRYRPVLAAALVALAVGLHVQNAQEYRAEWLKLQNFFWQLSWRAPQLEPGTLALFDVIPLNRYSDNDLTALLNWTYAAEQHTRQIPYKFFDLTIRLGNGQAGLPGLEKGLPVEHNHRGLFFHTTTSNMLALVYDPPGCLRILTPQDATLPGLPERILKALPITRIEQVRAAAADSARPPMQLGAEPAHGWCYTFEKAELARQQQNWQEVTALGDQAQQSDLAPGDPAELLPFIEGYARIGNVQRAQELSLDAAKKPGLVPALCAAWRRAAEQNPAALPPNGLGCQP